MTSSSSCPTGSTCSRCPTEEIRTPEGKQLEEIKASAFSNWYTQKKQAVVITRDETISGRGELAGEPVLDALLAEARLRWGLDAAAGLQLVAAERLIGDADRAVATRPARAGGTAPADRGRSRRRPRSTRAAGRPPRTLRS